MTKQTKTLQKPGSQTLTRYDPKKGLANVALAEAAEKHFARAKDPRKLEQAIRAKLEAQAEFVFWWDNHVEKDKGGRPGKTRSRSATGFQSGKQGIPERYIIDRWRKKLNDPDKFEATYQNAVLKYSNILEFETTAHVGQSTGECEWYTPPEYIEAARRVLGAIDLDPASTDVANEVVKASQIFTKEDDALNERWDGRVWMNPPYSQPLITRFCEKLAAGFKAGVVICGECHPAASEELVEERL